MSWNLLIVLFFTWFPSALCLANLSNFSPTEFVVVVPSYNNEKWCIKNLTSIVQQSYPHWKLYYINDASTDCTGTLIDAFIKKHRLQNKCTIVHNEKRQGSLANIYEAVHKIEPHKVILIVDGDDRLAHCQVLDILASVYADKNVWLTYGNFVSDPQGWGSCCEPISSSILQARSFRYNPWVFGHLRTFYAKLFHLIKKEDLQRNGDFFPMTGDMAFMFPMAEMASKDHLRFVPDILYIYNVANPINDHRVNALLLKSCDDHIRNMPLYQALEKLFD